MLHFTTRTVVRATARNIHQKSIGEAVRFANAAHAVTVEDASITGEMRTYWGDLKT